jgi:hypothetical protein
MVHEYLSRLEEEKGSQVPGIQAILHLSFSINVTHQPLGFWLVASSYTRHIRKFEMKEFACLVFDTMSQRALEVQRGR